MPVMQRARIRRREPLACRTSFGLGGKAELFGRIEREEDIYDATRCADMLGVPITVIAGGTGCLVPDEGVEGLVLDLTLQGSQREGDDGRSLITVGAGSVWDRFVAQAVGGGLRGLERLSGIPGTVGGAVSRDAAAYGVRVSESVHSIRVWNRHDAVIEVVPREHIEAWRRDFGRDPEAGRSIVLSATFQLPPEQGAADRSTLQPALGSDLRTASSVRRAILARRAARTPPDERSAGPFFYDPRIPADQARELAARWRTSDDFACAPTSASDEPIQVSAGWVIEGIGIARGTRRGAVGVSATDPAVLVHHGGGTAHDVLCLAEEIADEADRIGIRLERRTVLLGG